MSEAMERKTELPGYVIRSDEDMEIDLTAALVWLEREGKPGPDATVGITRAAIEAILKFYRTQMAYLTRKAEDARKPDVTASGDWKLPPRSGPVPLKVGALTEEEFDRVMKDLERSKPRPLMPPGPAPTVAVVGFPVPPNAEVTLTPDAVLIRIPIEKRE